MRRTGLSVAMVWVVGLLVLVTPASTGCSRHEDPLAGSEWRLAAWTASSIDPSDLGVSATFDKGELSGRWGVNTYAGPYDLGSGDSITLGQIVVTRRADDEATLRAEQIYVTLLNEARSYTIADDTLTLFDGGGNESLIFER